MDNNLTELIFALIIQCRFKVDRQDGRREGLSETQDSQFHTKLKLVDAALSIHTITMTIAEQYYGNLFAIADTTNSNY